MRRLACLLLVCSAHDVGAETRLDVHPIPDLATVEPVYPLDRGRERDHRRLLLSGSLTLGYGDEPLAAATLAAGLRGEHVSGGARSELIGAGDKLVRGRHRARLALQTWDDHTDDIGVRLELDGAYDHGRSVGLAPLALGTGLRDTAAARATAIFQLTPEDDDFVWAFAVVGSAGSSERQVLEAPGVRAQVGGGAGSEGPIRSSLDRALRRGGALAFGRVPVDGELPRGMVELLRGRVEHVTIERPGAAAGSGAGGAEVRLVELGFGPKDLTLHIDRELLAVLDMHVGWAWLEADTPEGRIADNMFRMQWAASLVGDEHPGDRKRFGLAIARQPTHTPDGQRLVSEWRVGLSTGVDRRRYLVEARGGIAWASVMAGGPPAPTLIRYGSQVEAFYKLGAGFEAGGFHAAWYEPAAGDPDASPRRWTVETGLALRFRPSRATAPRRMRCGVEAPSHLIRAY